MMSRPSFARFLSLLVLLASPAVMAQDQQADLPSPVQALFAQRCAIPACHSGPTPMQGMNLEPEHFLHSIVGKTSTERPDLQIVHPGRPDSSYLVMKVRGAEGIIGLQMPFSGEKLSEDEIGLIERWIEEGIDTMALAASGPPPSVVYPFPGWKIVDLPTARLLPRETLLFLISHRFVPALSAGYEGFYGLDGPGVINFSLGYALTDRLLFVASRSNSVDDVEAALRYQISQQNGPRRFPIALAVQGSVNWLTEDRDNIEEPVKFAFQVSASREIAPGLSLAFVPGILTNPAEEEKGDDVLITLGIGGRWNFYKRVSLVAEWAPMVAGYTRTTTIGQVNRYDHVGAGLEIATAGHVFQIVATNTLGLSTD
ncbi:MAG TPA: DUF5777 family beta-barrel protein, partial [Rhodothermales bacterium]